MSPLNCPVWFMDLLGKYWHKSDTFMTCAQAATTKGSALARTWKMRAFDFFAQRSQLKQTLATVESSNKYKNCFWGKQLNESMSRLCMAVYTCVTYISVADCIGFVCFSLARCDATVADSCREVQWLANFSRRKFASQIYA